MAVPIDAAKSSRAMVARALLLTFRIDCDYDKL
jgi:hypothetical protein